MKNFLIILTLGLAISASAADKKIVFIASKPSHAPGDHEHRAGSLLLKSCLDKIPGITSIVYSNGWPTDESAFEGVAAVVVYCDGGGGHALLQQNRLKTIGALMNKGVGLACLHYGVEPTLQKGQKEFLDWIGGAFEINWSVNPHWTADFKTFPQHPIANGVKPFQCNDEWYFNMRFRDGMKGVTPILTATPTSDTTNRNDGAHEGNPAVRQMVARGEPQHLAWASERPDGGRGFGFTGAHHHKNWGDDNFRKIVLNAILWIAKVEVPKSGVESFVSAEQLAANLDNKGARKP